MAIISPIHSFIDFQDRLEGVLLPIHNLYKLAFQFSFEYDTAGWNDTVKIKLVSADKNTVYADLPGTIHNLADLCAWCNFANMPTEDAFPITVASNEIIEAGTYNTLKDFVDALITAGLFGAPSTFLLCCSYGYSDNYTIDYSSSTAGGTVVISFKRGLEYVRFEEEAGGMDLTSLIPAGTCFRIAIENVTKAEIHYSNVLFRESKDTYLTTVEYSSNEDTYGFSYPAGVSNMVTLPMYALNPKYTEDRKVYIKSNKQYKVLHASIEKEWTVQTAPLADELHERINVLLAHDNITFSNRKINGTVVKNDEYKINWDDTQWGERTAVAGATFSINTVFAGRNSNCDQRPVCSFSPISSNPPPCIPVGIAGTIFLPDAIQGEPYNASVQLTGAVPFELVSADGPDWMQIDIAGDNVILSGTPVYDAINLSVNLTIRNCGSNYIQYADTIDVHPANGTHWDSDTEVAENDPTLQSWHDVVIAGQTMETVEVTCTSYSNDFGGTISLNGLVVTGTGNTFTYNLDVDGNSPVIQVRLQGLSVAAVGHPYGMSAAFTITSASGGIIGTPDIFQISKVFT